MHAITSISIATLVASAAPVAAQQATASNAAKIVEFYRDAYARGRDLVPEPQRPLDPAGLATALKLETVIPEAALTGNAFVDAETPSSSSLAPRAASRQRSSN
jgi:hypothetical protein